MGSFPDNILPNCWTGVRRAVKEAPDTFQFAWVDEEQGHIRSFQANCREGATNSPAVEDLEFLWRLFCQACREPINGEIGLPSQINVEDDESAQYMRQRLCESSLTIEVIVQPSEMVESALDEAAKRLTHSVGYLSRADNNASGVGQFFAAAKTWADLELWRHIHEMNIVIVEGLEDKPLTVVVTGADGKDKGLAIFDSPQDIAKFAQNPYLVRMFLQFCDGYVAGPGLQAEIAENSWPLAAPDMIPVASCPSTGLPFVGLEDMCLLMSVMDVLEAYCASGIDEHHLPVRQLVTTKCGEEAFITVIDHRQRLTSNKIGRNDPCPCGSGKKYKKCCWLKEQEELGVF